MKIYTKTGDKGKTALLSGNRVPKYHKRIEAYGTIDELNSFVGLLRSFDINAQIINTLINIQNKLLNLGTMLAADEQTKFEIPKVTEADIIFLENKIDKYNSELPKLTKFILPGGNQEIAHCHVCRTICRRAERQVVELSEQFQISDIAVKYLNRLSDFFFVLARKITADTSCEEIVWDS